MSTPHNGGMYCGPCYICKSEMWLPKELHDAARRSDTILFCCAYGHSQVFTRGDSDLDVMRRERDRLQQQLAERDDRIELLNERTAEEVAIGGDAERRAEKNYKEELEAANVRLGAEIDRLRAENKALSERDAEIIPLALGATYLR